VSDTHWTRTIERLPDRGQAVDWIAPDGVQVDGGRYEGPWFLPGKNRMYIYYTPEFWRPAASNPEPEASA